MTDEQKELDKIYETLKGRRVVLNKEEFAKKLNYSRAQMHRIMTSENELPDGLLADANKLLNATKNVSRETSPKAIIKKASFESHQTTTDKTPEDAIKEFVKTFPALVNLLTGHQEERKQLNETIRILAEKVPDLPEKRKNVYPPSK